jgi:hypothetical protein
MSKTDGLGYEQLLALRVMRGTKDMEGSAICKEAGCSFQELYDLSQKGLINIGSERLKPKALHPTMTAEGMATLDEAEREAII